MKKVFKEYCDIFLDKQEYILIYVVALLVLTIGMFSRKNSLYPTAEIIFFVFSVALGIFLILYSFKNKKDIHKVAFLIIIIVGGLAVFLAPPFIIPDEFLHINRGLTLLDGRFFIENPRSVVNKFYDPLYANLYHLFQADPGINAFILNNEVAFTPISNYSQIYAYEKTTPTYFYPYVLTAAGLFIAKYFNLGIIHAIWLSRMPNLIFYAAVVFFAIKRAPDYKMALLVVSCNPLIISLAASSNYDSFNYACLILAFAFFISMYKDRVKKRNFIGFVVCCLLMGLIKQQYLFVAILIFLIPYENYGFKKINREQYKTILIASTATILMGMAIIIYLIYAGIISAGVDAHHQLAYLSSHPGHFSSLFNDTLNFLPDLIVNTPGYRKYLVGSFKGVELYNALYLIFFVLFSILYPFKVKLSKNKKILLALSFVIFYWGMFFLIYAMWSDIGPDKAFGMQARYFIPLLPMIPLVLNYPIKKIKNMDYCILTGVVIFAVSLLMFLVTHFY